MLATLSWEVVFGVRWEDTAWGKDLWAPQTGSSLDRCAFVAMLGVGALD